MSKELPYYKFHPDQWLAGKISLEELDVQGAFTNICAMYWAKDCRVAISGLLKKYGVAMARLLESGIVHDNQGFAQIKFLDEQWSDLAKNHAISSQNGKEGAKKRWGKNGIDNQEVNSGAMATPIAIRKDKIRKDNIVVTKKNEIEPSKEKNTKPDEKEVWDYYYHKGRESDFQELTEKFLAFNEKIGWRGLAKKTWEELAESFLNYSPTEREQEESSNQYPKYTGE